MWDRLAGRVSQPETMMLEEDQVARRSTWRNIPDDRDAARWASSIIHTVPHGATTVTQLNPLDPATTAEGMDGWLEPPDTDRDHGPLYSAGRL